MPQRRAIRGQMYQSPSACMTSRLTRGTAKPASTSRREAVQTTMHSQFTSIILPMVLHAAAMTGHSLLPGSLLVTVVQRWAQACILQVP